MTMQLKKKDVVAHYDMIIRVPYCGIQYLLKGSRCLGYTAGVYGWNADVYDVGHGIAIVTGYRPFGNIKPPYELYTHYDAAAQQVWHSGVDYPTAKEQCNELLENFVADVRKEGKGK